MPPAGCAQGAGFRAMQVLDGNLSPKEAVDAVMNLPQMEES